MKKGIDSPLFLLYNKTKGGIIMNLEYENYRITTNPYNYIITKKIFSKKTNKYIN